MNYDAIPFLVNAACQHRRRGVRSEFLASFLGHAQIHAPGFVYLKGIGEHARPVTPDVQFRGDPFFGDDPPEDSSNERPSP
jgi:hypothetical protein